VDSASVSPPEKLNVAMVTPVVPIAAAGSDADSRTTAGVPAKSDQILAIRGCDPAVLFTTTLASVNKKLCAGDSASAISYKFGGEWPTTVPLTRLALAILEYMIAASHAENAITQTQEKRTTIAFIERERSS